MAQFDDLADVYDLLVPWEGRLKRETPFLTTLFQQHKIQSVLDTACGTGRHAVRLAQMGFDVVGTDISPSMIREARRHARKLGAKVKLIPLAFAELGSHFKNQADSVLCLGNSLAACGSRSAAKNALKNFATCLRPDGLLIMQILNFVGMRSANDRFESPKSGTKDGVEYLLFKFFDLDRPQVTLNMNIFTRDSNKAWSRRGFSKKLYSPTSTELRQLVRDAGFCRIKLYGNHQFESYHRNSDQLLLTAMRKK